MLRDPVLHRPLTEYQLAHSGRLISVSVAAPGLTPARFLAHAAGSERFYWRDGSSGVTFVGMGAALAVMGYGENRFDTIERQARSLFSHAEISVDEGGAGLAGPRLCGGFAFRGDFIPDVTWSAFHPAHFILPHYQLAWAGDSEETGEGWLTINALVDAGDDLADSQAQLREALAARLALLNETDDSPENGSPKTEPQIDYPLSFTEWAAMIAAAQDAFRTTPLKKVVLSRICQVRNSHAIDVDRALAQLNARYPGCYTFLFEPRPHHAFLGAPPELLVRVVGDQFETMSLAGSAPRGATTEEDAAHAAGLLASAKDRHEHALVVDALRRRLLPITRQLDMADEPQILTLSNIHHLHTPVRATLTEPLGVLPLVELLHPTPALGGSPRDLALAFIQEHEPTLRGWYAGPVGWIDANLDGSFAVAIRSAVVQERRAWLYAGGGIVPDSVPQQEWEETGWKFRPMLAVMKDES
ncbi:MAG: isochorismate synthase [Caldilineaceae bacterium]|nr:isochorismate synthase [Caldilineaceae bacterium]MBP8125457.1 isochorismate synthase [Caldilineaceae bacterium]MBP9072780.1 isochorismate synthase [Caldilineaceae bacterium]